MVEVLKIRGWVPIHEWDNYINHYYYQEQDSENIVEEGAEWK